MSVRMLLVFVLVFVAPTHAQEPQRIFVMAVGETSQNETAKVESELAKRCPKKVTETVIQDKAG